MTAQPTAGEPTGPAHPSQFPVIESPFLHAPEPARTVFVVTLAAACGPLLAGIVFFGWRAAGVAALSVCSCALIESLYFRVTRVPSLHGRSHAYLTGLLLALTLPPFVPWYVPVIASAFAIIIGKAVFGGVGHFLWQPALVGRLAAAVMFPALMAPDLWPVLARNRLVVGDVRRARRAEDLRSWGDATALPGEPFDALKVVPPQRRLAALSRPGRSGALGGASRSAGPPYSALVYVPVRQVPHARPAALMEMPPLKDLLYGARPGGIGETSAIVIIMAGLYLIYRNYVKWQLPVSFLLAAAAVAAVTPIQLAGHPDYAPVRTVAWPVLAEGPGVGSLYLCYHLLTGEMLLAAFFLATEMTSRPVTTGGRVIFGIGCGALAMLLRLHVDIPVPCYMAVLAMNTFTPLIDSLWRPRVLGSKRFWHLFRRTRRP